MGYIPTVVDESSAAETYLTHDKGKNQDCKESVRLWISEMLQEQGKEHHDLGEVEESSECRIDDVGNGIAVVF